LYVLHDAGDPVDYLVPFEEDARAALPGLAPGEPAHALEMSAAHRPRSWSASTWTVLPTRL
jgi:antitoxin (DNA-binding transcriptional repressor) of toxin-antitoxin stability system